MMVKKGMKKRRALEEFVVNVYQPPQVNGRGVESHWSEAKPKEQCCRPTNSHSSRSGISHLICPQSPMINLQSPSSRRPKVNPFGDVKPRKILLELCGKDYWQKDSELEHKAIDKAETQEK
ncbi:hypothetical protein SUGI_0691320 [Cryptomeria japonica]|nr:hypothetical protein SUGI_0691320 [Cryptomeria japonica]